ncbi:MAG TPA: FliA/WhiG family RNA polymerase sigma factor [Clostridia bacterium]|nr:FliA/WhiG family RNA polymerase sigma factor [Clostridia bacterium]
MPDTENLTAKALWEKYARSATQETKDEIVLHYLSLVKRIVYRLMPTFEGYSNFDDLLSCGILGLIDAINRFDYSRGVLFEKYATVRIRGEILDHMRKQDWAPTSLRRKIQAINSAFSELENKLSREPADSEVAEHLGMDDCEMQKIMSKMHMFNVMHFEELLMGEGSGIQAVRDTGETPEESYENKELKQLLANMIDDLPERERHVVTLYYYEELTLKEIADVLGVSESRASQIHSKVILKLKTGLEALMNS